MSTPITPTEAHRDLAFRLFQGVMSRSDAAQLIAESEARAVTSVKCPHVITSSEGTAHCSLAERDGQALAKEREKVKVVMEVISAKCARWAEIQVYPDVDTLMELYDSRDSLSATEDAK